MSINKKEVEWLPDERLRLEVKNKANEVILKFALKGITDIFDMIEDVAVLIRKPLNTTEISGFSSYYNDLFLVFTNSSFTLGHERFTAAHELYHIMYNKEMLTKEKVIFQQYKKNIEEDKANIFAAELLMPEDYVKELFYKLVNVEKDKVEVRHIVRLNSILKVSYKAMIKRLIQLDLCDIKLYDSLVEFGTVENAENLQRITMMEGYTKELIIPSKISYISKEFIEKAKLNFENNIISYGMLSKLLNFINQEPENYGYGRPNEGEFI